jgi:hypothetical protein
MNTDDERRAEIEAALELDRVLEQARHARPTGAAATYIWQQGFGRSRSCPCCSGRPLDATATAGERPDAARCPLPCPAPQGEDNNESFSMWIAWMGERLADSDGLCRTR